MTFSAPPKIDVRVLGPVEVARDGVVVALGGARQRALFALLALTPGRPAAADWLIDELWAGEPPEGAQATLRSYVSRLRASMGERAVIRGTSAGYALEVEPEQVDAVRFERMVGQGEAAVGRGAVHRAAERLREGLDMWRGRPFGGLADEGVLRVEAERLAELRTRALELRLETDLALGRSAELVAELETLVAEHPYRETFWRQLMLSLYRAERQADALAAFQRARAALDEQLGLEPSPELQALQLAILRQEVPAATPPNERHNLPSAPTSLIGRDRETAEVATRLGESRLITLTGVGGVGKTRLGLDVARRSVADFPAGVWFVDLAPLADPALVAAQVSSVLGIAHRSDVDSAEHLGRQLRDRELLLVLDNCEHLRTSCAHLALALLEAAPRVRVLATSREPLGVPGEVEYPVPPLGVPPPGASLDVQRDADAVRLFLARARDVRPDPMDDEAGLRTIAEICRDLDGLPLGIELAAARVRALSTAQIAARLADRFRFLVAWRRLGPARHRTLRQAMDWSYELLSPDERTVLARLSVFAGGFSLGAVAWVCFDDQEEPALEVLERLIQASLVVADPVPDGLRYRLLETVRQYAAERLAEMGPTDEIRRRHASHAVALARTFGLSVEDIGSAAPQRFDLAHLEQANMRAALDWAAAHDQVLGLELATALEQFWVATNPQEGMERFETLLRDAADVPARLRARALRDIGGSTEIAGNYERAAGFYKKSLKIFESLGDQPAILHLRFRLAFTLIEAGKLGGARRLVEDSLNRAIGRELQMQRSDLLRALAAIEYSDGRIGRAYDLERESLDLCRQLGGWPWGEAIALVNLATYATMLGRWSESERLGREALQISRHIGDHRKIVYALAALAAAARASGDSQRAGRLWGSIEAEEQRSFLGDWRIGRDDFAQRVTQPPSADFEQGRELGRQMSMDEAEAYALGIAR